MLESECFLYSSVENGELMDTRNFSFLANDKLNSILKKTIKDEVDKNIKINVINTVLKYSFVCTIINDILSVQRSKQRI